VHLLADLHSHADGRLTDAVYSYVQCQQLSKQQEVLLLGALQLRLYTGPPCTRAFPLRIPRPASYVPSLVLPKPLAESESIDLGWHCHPIQMEVRN
jgi:hypothetical protein